MIDNIDDEIMDIIDDSNNNNNNNNNSSTDGIVVDDKYNNDEIGSDPEKYFVDSNHENNITYYQDTIYEKEEEFTQSPGEYSLFGEIKGLSRDALINKRNPRNAKFYFACEICDDSYEIILSVKHRDIICSNKILLMICVQGEEKFRKVSLICLDKDWFDMNSQAIFETNEFKDNTSSLLTAAIENSDSLISIIPIEMRFFYPNDNEEKFQETPSNYNSELKDCYDLIYKKVTQDSLYRNELNVTAAAKLLRASVDLDSVLLHIGIELPPVPPIPFANTVSFPVVTTNQKPQMIDSLRQSNKETPNEETPYGETPNGHINQLANSLVENKSKNIGRKATARAPSILTEIVTENIIAPSSRICATRLKEQTTSSPKVVGKKKRNYKVIPKKSQQPASASKALAKKTTAKKTPPSRRNQVNLQNNLPIISPETNETFQLPSNNASVNKNDNNNKSTGGVKINTVDSITPVIISQDAQKIIDGLLAEKQALAARLSAAECQAEKTSSTISDLQLRVQYLATVKNDKESGGHRCAGATIKAVDSMYNHMFSPIEKQNGYDFSKSFDENKAFGSEGSSGRPFFEPAVPLGQSNYYNDYAANYYNNHPHASNTMIPAVHPNYVNGGMNHTAAINTATPLNHQFANNVGSGQQFPLASHLTPNTQQLYYPSPHTSTSYNQYQQPMCLPPITQSPAFNNHYHYHNNNTESLRQSQASSKDLGSLILGLGLGYRM